MIMNWSSIRMSLTQCDASTVRKVPFSSSPNRVKDRRKRRRKIYSLDVIRRPQPPFTALDHQRLLVERNLTVRKPLEKQLSHYLDLAESRLAWARSQVFQLWDPEWRSKAIQGGEGTAARTPRPLVVMDARWWRWNIAFALLPAILIGTYCEFRGQYMMYEFHQEQELEQIQRLMGEEYVEAHRDELIQPLPENFLKRIWISILELNDYILGQSTDEPWLESGSPSAEQGAHNDARSSTVPISSSSARDFKAPATAIPTASEIPNIGELLARLQHLEAVVLENNESRGSRELARLQQSGVQNRMEDAIVDSLNRSAREKLSAQAKQVPERTDSQSRYLEPILVKVSEVVARVGQLIRDVASSRSKTGDDPTDSPGLKGAAQPARVVPNVSETPTNQSGNNSTNQVSSSTSDDVSRRRKAGSRWPWA